MKGKFDGHFACACVSFVNVNSMKLILFYE